MIGLQWLILRIHGGSVLLAADGLLLLSKEGRLCGDSVVGDLE